MSFPTALLVLLLFAALAAVAAWYRRRMQRSETLGWAFEQAPVAMAIVDPRQDFRLITANRRWFEQFGRENDAAIGRNGRELDLWEREQDRDAMIVRLRHCPSEAEIEAPLRRADGSRIWCRISGRHLLLRGRPQLLLAMQDIQAQRELEESLRDSEAVARQIFDVVPEALLISNADTGEFIEVNRAWVDRIGYQKDELIGKTSRDINLWVDLPAIGQMAGRFAKNGQLDGELQQIRRADGETREFEISARQWQSSTRRLSIWIARDVTDKRRAQQALEELNATLEERVAQRTGELADALDVVKHAQDELVRTQRLSSLGALVAGIAHELNTPIGNAVLASSTLQHVSGDFDKQRRGPLTRSALEQYTASVSEISGVLESNLQRAVELINGFKQLAVDQSSYQRRSFSLRSVVDEVLLTLRPTLRRKPYAVDVEVPESLAMDSFPGPLGQVLINLINNAVLHAFDGREQGRIRVSAQADGEDQLLLRVEDDGLGIPAAHLDRIFDPFFTTRLGQGGSGLGLHICFSLVNSLLGGSIEAGASELGGAAFTLRLPRVAPVAQPSDEAPLP
jgi:PAS domain S-box-containing protein